MSGYFIRRVLATILVLFGVSVLIFGLMKLTPGDAARAQLPSTATQEQIADMRTAMGLNGSIVEQYAIWLGKAAHGDMGLSYQHRVPALALVQQRFVNTLVLAGTALVIAVVVGVTIGVIAGTRPNSFVDRTATLLGVVAASVPTYWLGIVLLLVFSLQLKWFPAVGMYDPRGDKDLKDLLLHLALPAITTAAVPAAIITRMVRSSVLEVMTLDYIRTARAKGLKETYVVRNHALRSALPNFITIVALQAGYLLGGSLIAEIVFTWPGIGLQLYTAVGARDMPIIMTVTLIVALVFTSLNLVADLLQGVVDPRVQIA